MSARSIGRRPASAQDQQVRPDLHVLESDPKAVRRRHIVDDVWIAVTCVLLAVFMIGLMKYVLSPAVSTVTNATARSSAAGGP